MDLIRKLHKEEERLLFFLVNKSDIQIPTSLLTEIRVKPLKDGGMGSLLLIPKGLTFDSERFFGKRISECQFIDKDKINVIASLNIDDKGNLFELDIWKTDFSPLIKISEKLK